MNDVVVKEIVDSGNKITFEIRKFSASQGEDWLMKALHLLGANLDLEAMESGKTATVASLIHALCRIPYHEAKDLLNDLLSQCYRVEGKMKTQVTLEDADTFFRSPVSIIKLRIEAAKANFDFFTDLKELVSQEMGNIE